MGIYLCDPLKRLQSGSRENTKTVAPTASEPNGPN
jgi:hypothetical protein